MLDDLILGPVIFLATEFNMIVRQDVCSRQMGIIEVLVTPEKELNCARQFALLLLVLLQGEPLGLVQQNFSIFLGKHGQNFLHLCLSFTAEQCVRVAAAMGTVLLACRRRGRVIVPLCGWEMRAQGCRALLGGSELKSLGALA